MSHSAAVTVVTIEEPLNLTPHDIVIAPLANSGTGVRVTLRASGTVARLATTPQVPLAVVRVGPLDCVEAYSPPTFTDVIGLESLGATSTRAIVVSSLVAEHMLRIAHPYHGAVLAPDAGPGSAVRDAAGQIVAVRRLVLYR